MDGHPFRDDPEPNIVLRGGPFDGERMRVEDWGPVSLAADGRTFVYTPAGETDDEYERLAVYAVVSDLPTWPSTLT